MKKLITGILLSGVLVATSCLVASAGHTHNWTLNGYPYSKVISTTTHKLTGKQATKYKACTVKKYATVTNKICKSCGATVTETIPTYETHSVSH